MLSKERVATAGGALVAFFVLLIIFIIILLCSSTSTKLLINTTTTTVTTKNSTTPMIIRRKFTPPPVPYEIAYRCNCEIRYGGCFQELHSVLGYYKYMSCGVKVPYSTLRIEKRQNRILVVNFKYQEMKQIHDVLNTCFENGRAPIVEPISSYV